jgi:hypothetical protein
MRLKFTPTSNKEDTLDSLFEKKLTLKSRKDNLNALFEQKLTLNTQKKNRKARRAEKLQQNKIQAQSPIEVFGHCAHFTIDQSGNAKYCGRLTKNPHYCEECDIIRDKYKINRNLYDNFLYNITI